MKYLCTIVGLLIFAVPASAGLQIVNGSDPTDIPSHNDFKSIPGPNNDLGDLGFDKVFNGGADVLVTENGTISFYYHGAESGYVNEFFDGSGVLKTENNEQPLQLPGEFIGQIDVTSGDTFSALGIGFRVKVGDASAQDGIAGTQGFGVFFSSQAGAGGIFSQLFFGFDDNGASRDDNHDDMIVSAIFTAAPEPLSLVVWGGLICAIGAISWRKRRPNCR